MALGLEVMVYLHYKVQLLTYIGTVLTEVGHTARFVRSFQR